MSEKKVIQSLKIDIADYNKYVYIDDEGNASYVSPDEDHVEITATTDNSGDLTKSIGSNADQYWDYSLENFTLASGNIEDIRGIWVSYTALTNNNDAYTGLRATFPWDDSTYHYVFSHGGENDNQVERAQGIFLIPIRKDQYGVGIDELKLRLNSSGSSSASFTILAAKINTM